MERPILVCGLDALGVAVIRRLIARGIAARALAAPTEAASYAHELERLGVPVCVGVARSAGALQAAGLQDAAALVLTADDDAENVDAALTARRLSPEVPIVARIFDPSLGAYLEESGAGLTILSVSGLASPRYAELAEKVALPAGTARPSAEGRSHARSSLRVDPILVRLTIVTTLVVVFSVWFFARALGLSPFDAFYFVVESITNTGFGDVPMGAAGIPSRLLTIALMIGGAGLLALVYALITGWFVARRFDVLQGRVPERGSDHVVIAGAGNVGFRVAQLLAEKGRSVVVIEREGSSVNAAQLRAEGRHVIVGDAGLDESLELAAVGRASVVMALTDSDAVNLRMALAVRRRHEEVPIVLRLISPELSEHLHGRRGMTIVSPIAVASERIADAAVEAILR
ncbi:MAG TPA: NAD-binding protein [Candidatus Polarisedimenticolaceae bacterium]|nr:NAD-binding protein [Candidatus Polarisedimenticolaceae bacterium]